MTLTMDPLTAAAVVMIVTLVAYNQNRSPENEDNLEVRSFWCLGICAKLDGEHSSPSTGEEQSNESTNSGRSNSGTDGMRDNDNDS